MNTNRHPSIHPGGHPSTSDLDHIGRTIDTVGFAAVPAPQLDAVVGYARDHGLRPVATSVLADAAAPTVARVRAFGLVALAVGRDLTRAVPERSAA